jgi:hypothetical protein
MSSDKGHLHYGRDNQPDARGGVCAATASVFAETIGQLIANIEPTLTPAIKTYQSWWAWRELLPKAHLNYRNPLPGEIPACPLTKERCLQIVQSFDPLLIC